MVIGQTNQGETGPGLQRSQPGRPRLGLKAGMRAKEGGGAWLVTWLASWRLQARVKPVVFSCRDTKVSPNWRTVGKPGQGREKRRWSLDELLLREFLC